MHEATLIHWHIYATPRYKTHSSDNPLRTEPEHNTRGEQFNQQADNPHSHSPYITPTLPNTEYVNLGRSPLHAHAELPRRLQRSSHVLTRHLDRSRSFSTQHSGSETSGAPWICQLCDGRRIVIVRRGNSVTALEASV